ncbi:hypothetical protein ACOSQ4_022220 [Xanthoceras sorbifolium]
MIENHVILDQQMNHLDTTRLLIKEGVTSPNSIKLCQYFQKLSCHFSLTIDEDRFEGAYTCLSVHFINDDWNSEERIISLKRIKDNQDFRKYLKNVLLEWGIHDNISSIVKIPDHDTYVISCNERENWFNSQGSLPFNNKLLYDDPIDYIDDTSDDLLHGVSEFLYCCITNIVGYITKTSSKNENFQIAIERAKFLGKKVSDEIIPTKLNPLLLKIDRAVQYCKYVFPLDLAKYEVLINDHDSYGTTVRDVDKYWSEYNFVLAIAVVLDPRFKIDIEYLTIFTNYFTNVYNEYAKGANNVKSSTLGSQKTNSSISYKMLDSLGKRCKYSHDSDHVQSLNSELHLYLNELKFPLIEDFDILEWWRDNTWYFPTLAKIARDFLSIQISTGSLDTLHLHKIEGLDLEDFDFDMVLEAYICTEHWL